MTQIGTPGEGRAIRRIAGPEVYSVDRVDWVDDSVGMKTEMLVCEKKPAKAPAAQPVLAEVAPRLRGTMKAIFGAMQGFHSSSRQELLAAAKGAGYTDAEFNAVLEYLVKTPVLVGVAPAAKAAKVETAGRKAKPKAFDPQEAGQRLVEELQAGEGGAWLGSELQARFHLTPATLHRRRKEHRIIYWRDARHQFHYPRWQFTPVGALLPGVQEVLQIFRSEDEWGVMSYFLGQRRQLGDRRPVDLLRAGEKDKVVAHAKLHADENTW